jgi:hypothetical protein
MTQGVILNRKVFMRYSLNPLLGQHYLGQIEYPLAL